MQYLNFFPGSMTDDLELSVNDDAAYGMASDLEDFIDAMINGSTASLPATDIRETLKDKEAIKAIREQLNISDDEMQELAEQIRAALDAAATSKPTVTHTGTDQNWKEETTIHWFDIEGESKGFGIDITGTFGWADNNGHIAILDEDGFPLTDGDGITEAVREAIQKQAQEPQKPTHKPLTGGQWIKGTRVKPDPDISTSFASLTAMSRRDICAKTLAYREPIWSKRILNDEMRDEAEDAINYSETNDTIAFYRGSETRAAARLFVDILVQIGESRGLDVDWTDSNEGFEVWASRPNSDDTDDMVWRVHVVISQGEGQS